MIEEFNIFLTYLLCTLSIYSLQTMVILALSWMKFNFEMEFYRWKHEKSRYTKLMNCKANLIASRYSINSYAIVHLHRSQLSSIAFK